VLEYYVLLRSIHRTKPHLPVCLARCRHCGIFFPTHRRNARRRNLGCLFGCREAHRRKASTERSVAYYQADRDKKRRQNAKRSGRGSAPVKSAAHGGQEGGACLGPEPSAKKAPAPDTRPAKAAGAMAWCPAVVSAALPKVADPKLMENVRVALSLIEGRRIGLEEIGEMLARVLRQHRMPNRRRIDHTVAWLNAHPP
jgi:hypothetical protein